VVQEFVKGRAQPVTSSTPSDDDIAAAQEDAAAASNEIAETEKTRLERAIKAHERLLDLRFEQRIKDHMDEVLAMYSQEYDRYREINDAYSGVFADEEYRLLLSALHPDRCPPDRTRQFEKAFHLVKSKEQLLCKAKTSNEPKSLPSSLEELLSRRKRR
jgi:hypothetical protein